MKLIHKLLAVAVSLPLLSAVTALPAQATTNTPINSWATTLTPQTDGSVEVSSEISAIPEGESIDIAYPLVPGFDPTNNYAGRNDAQYVYSSPQVSTGYTADMVTKDGWVIYSIKHTPGLASSDSPLTFKYTTANSVFDSQNIQQMNLPLIDATFGKQINNYSVKFVENGPVVGPTDLCLSKPNISTECLPTENNTWSGMRNINERLSLRAKFPTNTFTIPEIPSVAGGGGANEDEQAEPAVPAALVLPQKYLQEYKSWSYNLDVNASNGVANVQNTVTFDSETENSDKIVIAYPVLDTSNNDEAVYKQIYSNVALSDESAQLYDVNFQADDPDVYQNGLAIITITKKPDAVIPPGENSVTYSYSLNGLVMVKATSKGWNGDGQEIVFAAKHSTPGIVVNNINVKISNIMPTPDKTLSSCLNSNSLKCTNPSESELNVTGNINRSFYVVYDYSDYPFTVASPTMVVDKGIDATDVGHVVLIFVSSLLLGVAAYFAWMTGGAIMRKRKLANLYKTAEGKAITFIPREGQTGYKTLISKVFKASNIKYATPTTDDGRSIPSYMYPLLSSSKLNYSVSKVILSALATLASKQLLDFKTDKVGLYVTSNNKDYRDYNLSELEKYLLEETLKLTLTSPKGIRVDASLINVLYTDTCVKIIQTEIEKAKLFEIKKASKLANIFYVLIGLAVTTLPVIFIIQAGFLMPWYLLTTITVFLGVLVARLGLLNMASARKVYTVNGTGTKARIQAFKNYYGIARKDSMYSIEQNDVKGEYLPWAIAFNDINKWLDVFANTQDKSVQLNGSVLDALSLKVSINNIMNADSYADVSVDNSK